MDDLDDAAKAHLGHAMTALKAAGAGENGPADEHSTVNTANNPEHKAPQVGDPGGHSAAPPSLPERERKAGSG